MSRATVQQHAGRVCRWVALALMILLTGCASLGYYYQSARGQLSLMSRSRAIDEVLQDEATPQDLKTRLGRVTLMRRFASTQLALPDNDSYRDYVELDREYVVWNVFAAPELSVAPRQWCFPVVGCVVYRGYFSESAARDYARSLEARGLDTLVAGVPAYSTIGWFDDPVPSTIIDYPDTQLAGLIFHELAHQVAYVRDDSVFNESFATTVEIEGVERWLRHQGRDTEIEAYRRRRARDARVVDTILAYRHRLEAVYQSGREPAWQLEQKAAIIAALRGRYRSLTADWPGYRGYRRWFGQELNNAHFVPIAAYHDRVVAFRNLLARHRGDLDAFYEAVKDLTRRPQAERDRYLDRLEAGGAAPDPELSTPGEESP